MTPLLTAALLSLPGAASCASTDAGLARRVAYWAAGPDHRGNRPSSADSQLLLVPVGAQPPRAWSLLPACVHATSFIPAPAGDPRLFFAVRGQLHVSPARGSAPIQLDGADPARAITRLLAFAAASSPLQILALVRPDDDDAEQLWILTVGERAILHAEQVEEHRAFNHQRAFFTAFVSPRCLLGDRHCLVLGADERAEYVDVEPRRGDRPQPLQDLGNTHARDAAWATGDGSAFYLLASCAAPSR